MAIVHQSAMTEERASTRPPSVSTPHALVEAESQATALTLLKIMGLVAIAALGTAFAAGIVLGSALFLMFSLS